MPKSENTAAQPGDWNADIYHVLKSCDVRHMAYVPDAGHSGTIKMFEADNDVSSVVLTTEEEGIPYLAGASLGGERGVLLMQSSGVGNCINMLSLQVNARFPLLMLITMRGDYAEFNQALKLMGVMTWRADKADDVAELVRGAAKMAFEGDHACAVLLGQRLIGEKEWNK